METGSIPHHIGFIVDGNRRWARAKNLPTLEGHKAGLSKVETITSAVINSGVEYVSFYLFSTENWQRSSEEVAYLMRLAQAGIANLAKKMQKNNVRCVVIGSKDHVSSNLLSEFAKAEKLTADCNGGTACFCFNYGGQQEIVDAAKLAAQSGEINLESISHNLYHPEIPPLDLIVRTSGEQRLSGYMLWRAAYAELLFLEKNWPDIDEQDVKNILKEYANRNRRFGK